MQKPSKFAKGVQQFVLKGSVYCLEILLLNLRIAFSDLPTGSKFGFALASWTVMAAVYATAVTLWRIRGGVEALLCEPRKSQASGAPSFLPGVETRVYARFTETWIPVLRWGPVRPTIDLTPAWTRAREQF